MQDQPVAASSVPNICIHKFSSAPCSFVHSFVCSFVPSFLCSFVHSFLPFFHFSYGYFAYMTCISVYDLCALYPQKLEGTRFLKTVVTVAQLELRRVMGMWVLGIELWSPGGAAGAANCWSISLALQACLFRAVVFNFPNAATLFTQFLMLWWPPPTIKLFYCYIITVTLLLLWLCITSNYIFYFSESFCFVCQKRWCKSKNEKFIYNKV